MRRRKTFTCPHCQAEVSVSALACPACGSDAASGWSENADSWVGDLPTGYDEHGDGDEDAEYEEFLRAEGLTGEGRPSRETLRRRRVAAVCLLLVVCVLLWLLRFR